MSREKEIIEAANQRTMEIFGELDDFQDRTEGFIDGAKWADKTIIDKACEWLKFHVSVPCEIETTDISAKEYLAWAKKRLEAAEEICNDFRKAMEE